MSMKLAILYDDDRVFVEFEEKKFRKLFKKYFDEAETIDGAFDRVIADLKKEQLYK